MLPAPEPRPWVLREQGEANQFCVLDTTGKRWILGLLHNGEPLPAQQEANLRFVVGSVNCHDALVAALRGMMAAHPAEVALPGFSAAPELVAARSVLALVEKEIPA